MSDESVLSPTDAELLLQFSRHGDEAAFRTLVERHASLVLGTCRQILRHDHDVDDAFQATFLVLALKASGIKKRASVASWLYQVAFRTAMRAAKQRQRRRADSLCEDASVADDPLVKIHEQSLQKALHEELSALPDSYRAPIVLCYLQQNSRQEAATQLECTESSVKARLARGKRMLRLKLARRGIGLSVALAFVTDEVAQAAESVPAELLAQTMSICAQGTGGPESVPTDGAPEIVRLAQQGIQSMAIPTLYKTTAAVFVIGAAVVTYSINAEDEGTTAGVPGTNSNVISDASLTSPVSGDSNQNFVVAQIAQSQPVEAESPENNAAYSSTSSSRSAASRPSSGRSQRSQANASRSNYYWHSGASEPVQLPTSGNSNYWWSSGPSSGPSDQEKENSIAEMELQHDYLMRKASAYKTLAESYSVKMEARPKDVSKFDRLQAAGQHKLNEAEAAKCIDEAKLLQKRIQQLRGANQSKTSKPTTKPTRATPVAQPSATNAAENTMIERGYSPSYGSSNPYSWRKVPPTAANDGILKVGQRVSISCYNCLPNAPLKGVFVIEPGTDSVALGPAYGRVKIAGLDLLAAEKAIKEHLEEIVQDPKVQVTFPPQTNPYGNAAGY